MFGSVVLDIVISLVFIFLLYSLLATVLVEIIATWFNLRSKNLKKAVRRMLEDDHSVSWIFIARNLFNRQFWQTVTKQNISVIKTFYDQPSIKYLGRKNRMPSYLSPQTFSKTLLDLIKKEAKGNQKNELDKIKSGLKKSNSSLDSETRSYIKSLLKDAQNDLVKFKSYLEEWFDQTMERAIGWYKRQMQKILLVVGLIIAISFNANVVEMMDILSTDKQAREQLVSMANAYVENNKIDFTDKTKSDSLLNEKLDSLLSVQKQVREQIDEVNSILGLGWSFPDSIKAIKWRKVDSLKKTMKVLYAKQDSFLVDFGDRQTLKKSKYYDIKTACVKNEKAIYYASFDYTDYVLDSLLGYLLLALAVSMGAPFWFDLLNKLVKLRSSVRKPTQQQISSSSVGDQTVPSTQRVG